MVSTGSRRDFIRVGVQRIRLQGIDAPESKQRCRAGGETWLAAQPPPGHFASASAAGRSSAPSATATATGVSARCAGSAAPTRTPGWSSSAGRWRTGSTRRITSRTRPPRRRPVGACGEASSSSRRAGAAGRGSRPRRRAERAIAVSSGISVRRARASTTCRVGASYAKTRIDTATGERGFCTESEARAAGWWRAKRRRGRRLRHTVGERQACIGHLMWGPTLHTKNK